MECLDTEIGIKTRKISRENKVRDQGHALEIQGMPNVSKLGRAKEVTKNKPPLSLRKN